MSVDTAPSGVGIDLEFMVGFRVGIGNLTEEIRRLRGAIERQSRLEVPRGRREILASVPPNNNNVAPASGVLALGVDGPQLGVLWEVRTVYVGAANITTAIAGTAYVFFGSFPPSDFNITMAKDLSLTPLPVKGTWSTGVFQLRPPQNLYVIITGATSGATYAAVADVVEYPDTPLMATAATV